MSRQFPSAEIEVKARFNYGCLLIGDGGKVGGSGGQGNPE